MQGLLSLAGVRPPQPGDDTVADRSIRQAVAMSFCAHQQLRHNLKTDPGFAGIICRALGCATGDCEAPLPVVASRIEQIPPIIDRLTGPTTPRVVSQE